MKIPFFIVMILLAGCHAPKKDNMAEEVKTKNLAPGLSIIGDFNGDGKAETLIQGIVDSTRTAVKYIPETPAEIENDTTTDSWYNYVAFYYKLNYRTQVKAASVANKPLYFDNCQGLYCLINVGNLNNSPGDEIALVIDRLDFSRANDCQIYTLCNGVWQQVFEFTVHEDAFDFTGDTMPVLENIPGVLELKDGVWKYYDYMDMPYEKPEDVGQMLPLRAADCK